MKFFNAAPARLMFLFAAVFIPNFSVFAQDGEPVVVDEVVAQVNDGVITLSRIKREIKNAVEGMVQQQGKTPEEASREMEAKRPELIASLINEELLIQQGKELGLESEVEAEVNQRFLAIMKEQNLKTLEELYKRMREQGVEPDDIKAMLRKEYTKQFVFNRDVDGKIYFALTDKEVKEYYEKNKDKFRKPETITFSEIFLSFAGRNEAEVKAKAADLVRQLRGGANFKTLAAQHSERAETQKEGGKVGTAEVNNLNPLIADAVKNVKAGGVSDPIRTDEGMMILRVDERLSDNAAPTFDVNRVRSAITAERSNDARKKYLENLRKDAYIKISESYRASVMPVLSKNN